MQRPKLHVEWLGRDVPYADALTKQEALVDAKIRAPDAVPDTLLLLEHASVYTIGRTPDRSSLRQTEALLPHPLFTIARGGQATYHGPGQLVGYPILDLARRGRDLHRYLRALEEVLITALATHGIAAAARRAGLTGVWVADRKIASIGVGVRRWISFHGFAVNVTRAALDGFLSITPCGIAGVTMTSIENETGHALSPHDFAQTVADICRAQRF
ncbi:MAG: lipoyl(octanoyl) transferase LipB [Verrucomicrobia bacterium]|nr:lipoyl(octanoyl) transferase LipB [Verrucomicrobiota bacterium]